MPRRSTRNAAGTGEGAVAVEALATAMENEQEGLLARVPPDPEPVPVGSVQYWTRESHAQLNRHHTLGSIRDLDMHATPTPKEPSRPRVRRCATRQPAHVDQSQQPQNPVPSHGFDLQMKPGNGLGWGAQTAGYQLGPPHWRPTTRKCGSCGGSGPAARGRYGKRRSQATVPMPRHAPTPGLPDWFASLACRSGLWIGGRHVGEHWHGKRPHGRPDPREKRTDRPPHPACLSRRSHDRTTGRPLTAWTPSLAWQWSRKPPEQLGHRTERTGAQ